MGILTSDLVCEVSRDFDRRSRDDRRSREMRSCSRKALRDIGPLLISSFTPLQMRAICEDAILTGSTTSSACVDLHQTR